MLTWEEVEARRLERFARACGPKALACVLDIESEEAARMLSEHEPKARFTCDIDSIAKVLGLDWEVAEGIRDTSFWGGGSCMTRPKYWSGVPTVARFLRENPYGDFILRTAAYRSGHFINVSDGEVVQDNGYGTVRHRVTHFIFIDYGKLVSQGRLTA